MLTRFLTHAKASDMVYPQIVYTDLNGLFCKGITDIATTACTLVGNCAGSRGLAECRDTLHEVW
jgi:hypothetical protein